MFYDYAFRHRPVCPIQRLAGLFRQAWENWPEALASIQEKRTVILDYETYIARFSPRFNTVAQPSWRMVDGNQSGVPLLLDDPSPITMERWSLSAGIDWQLPANGQLALDLGLGIEHPAGFPLYRNSPSLRLRFVQGLSSGIFDVTADSGTKVRRLEMDYHELRSMQYRLALVGNVLDLVSGLSIAQCEEQYLAAASALARSRLSAADALAQQGRLSQAQLFELQREEHQSAQNLALCKHKQNKIHNSLRQLGLDPLSIPDAATLQAVLAPLAQKDPVNPPPLDSDLSAQRAAISKGKMAVAEDSNAPQLIIDASLSPSTPYQRYLDSSKSWTDLLSPEFPWDLSWSIGLRFNGESQSIHTLRAQSQETEQEYYRRLQVQYQEGRALETGFLLREIEANRTYQAQLAIAIDRQEEQWRVGNTRLQAGTLTSSDVASLEVLLKQMLHEQCITKWQHVQLQLRLCQLQDYRSLEAALYAIPERKPQP